MVLLVLAAGTAWAAGSLDGLTDDWSSADQLGADDLVLFAKEQGGDLCFRIDFDALFDHPPTAVGDAATVLEDASATRSTCWRTTRTRTAGRRRSGR